MAEDANTCQGRSWSIDWGDLGGAIGISLIILAAGYAGCEDSTLRARGKLIDACRKIMVEQRPIPDMCTAVVK